MHEGYTARLLWQRSKYLIYTIMILCVFCYYNIISPQHPLIKRTVSRFIAAKSFIASSFVAVVYFRAFSRFRSLLSNAREVYFFVKVETTIPCIVRSFHRRNILHQLGISVAYLQYYLAYYARMLQ